VVKAGVPLSPKLAVKQHSGGRHLQLVQRRIKTIVLLWRQFHADADADSISSTVMSPAYMYIKMKELCTAVKCDMKCRPTNILLVTQSRVSKFESLDHLDPTRPDPRILLNFLNPTRTDPWVGSKIVQLCSGATSENRRFARGLVSKYPSNFHVEGDVPANHFRTDR